MLRIKQYFLNYYVLYKGRNFSEEKKKVKEIYITLDPPPMEENVLKLKSLTDTEC